MKRVILTTAAATVGVAILLCSTPYLAVALAGALALASAVALARK